MNKVIEITHHFLDKQDFADYIQYRIEVKKPLTPTGQRRAINKLEKLYKEGHDVSAIIDQSITNNWLGLFTVKEKIVPLDNKDEFSVAREGKRLNILPKIGESSFDFARRVMEAKRG
jgi:hypothetical protein